MADRDGRLSPACLDDLEDESLDPRIQVHFMYFVNSLELQYIIEYNIR